MSWANNVSRTLLYDIVCIPDLTWFMVYCQKHIHWLIVHEMKWSILVQKSHFLRAQFPYGQVAHFLHFLTLLDSNFEQEGTKGCARDLWIVPLNTMVQNHFNTIFVWLVTLVITAPFYKKYVRTSCMHICCFQSLITPFASSHWKNNYIEWNWRNWKFENSVLHFLMLIIVTQTKMHFKIEEEFWSDSDEKCIGTLQFFPF